MHIMYQWLAQITYPVTPGKHIEKPVTCQIMLFHALARHVTSKDNEIVMSDVSRSTTKVTIKDAPYEMDDADVKSKLENFGEIDRKARRSMHTTTQ